MSQVSLQIESFQEKPLYPPKIWSPNRWGGVLGRSSECEFVLEDPSRVISRAHARVSLQENQTLLWEQLGGNPTVHNGRPVSMHNKIELKPGDQIELADYVLKVVKPTATSAGYSPFSSESGVSGFQNEPASGLFSSPSLPENVASPSEAAFSDFMKHQVVWQNPVQESVSTSVAPTQPSHEPIANFVPQREETDMPLKAADVNTSLQPLLEGLGLDANHKLTQEQLYLIGKLLRDSLEGFSTLLSLRKHFKKELKGDVTQFMQLSNNPLKFCANVNATLSALLAPEELYLKPTQAVQEAVSDLVAHQKAVASGLDQGFMNMVAYLNPGEIQDAVATKQVIPFQKPAGYWKEYQQRYTEIFESNHDPFESVFGQSFRAAFEAQKKQQPFNLKGKLNDD